MNNVLIIEDDKEICVMIKDHLEKYNYQVFFTLTGANAIERIKELSPDLIILDLMLPEVGGMTVLKYISDKCLNTGVIILTAKEELGDKLKAFNLGANDYLTKPFFMEELKARINAILKSMGKVKTANILEFKDLKIDMKTKKIYINDNEIELNEKLYKLLEYLVLNKGVLLFKEQIFDNICGYNSDAATEIIEVYISRLRKQLNTFGYGKYLVTKRGMGYILDESADE